MVHGLEVERNTELAGTVMRICSIWLLPAAKVSHLFLIGKRVNSWRMKQEAKERTNCSDTSWWELVMQATDGGREEVRNR